MPGRHKKVVPHYEEQLNDRTEKNVYQTVTLIYHYLTRLNKQRLHLNVNDPTLVQLFHSLSKMFIMPKSVSKRLNNEKVKLVGIDHRNIIYLGICFFRCLDMLYCKPSVA